MVKVIFISLGTISLCLGFIGIAVPGLPTTPFLLLAAGLYVKSSEKMYNKLITNKIAGPYIQKFRTDKGMTMRVKVSSVSIMWIMIACSCFFFISSPATKSLVLIVGLIGTIVMGFLIPTVNSDREDRIG